MKIVCRDFSLGFEAFTFRNFGVAKSDIKTLLQRRIMIERQQKRRKN